jgi:hypothetical protein
MELGKKSVIIALFLALIISFTGIALMLKGELLSGASVVDSVDSSSWYSRSFKEKASFVFSSTFQAFLVVMSFMVSLILIIRQR